MVDFSPTYSLTWTMRGKLIRKTWLYDSTLYAPPRYRRACTYDAFLPDRISGDFSLDAAVTGIVSDAEAAIRDLNSANQPALRPLARLLLRTESIASSKVEGMQMAARDVARAEARLETGISVGPMALEIVGNIEAMELAIAGASEATSFRQDDILAIHRKLMEGAPNAHIAGRWRTTQNWIGGNDHNPCGADFVPPPVEYLPTLLEDLCEAINDETLPPLVQAAIVHAQFETIHPFDDGNGRTGRALIHVVLRRRGVATDYVPPISVVLATNREKYIDGLSSFRADELNAWIEQFATATAQAAVLAKAYVAATRRLMEDWRHRLMKSKSPRADAAAFAIIDVLPAHPIVSAPVAEVATHRAKSAIHTAIADLVEAGVLIPLSQSKRNRTWEADGLLDLMTRLENGQLPPADEVTD